MVHDDNFFDEVLSDLESRIRASALRPQIEVWPEDDDFANWLTYHEAKERAVICKTPEFKDTPFCGTGYH
jgi:hypothetical protein